MEEREVPKDVFDAAIDAAMKSDGEKDFVMTEEEAKKFREAFEEPEFRKLFADYVDEISDPKYREEAQQYISQLEGEKKVPEGKELVRPEAAFVIKTHLLHKNTNAETRQKIFINVVQSTVVAAPSSQPAVSPTSSSTGNGKPGGANWSLPYCVGQVRMDRDKKDQTVPTVDVCLHPESITRAKQSAAFKNLLAQVAIEGVEKQYAALGQPGTTLEKKYHVLKGVLYKTGKPGVMLVAKDKKAQWDEGKASSSLKKECKKEEIGASKSAKPTPKQANGKPSERKNTTSQAKRKDQSKPIQEDAVGPALPEYTIIERGNFELSAHLKNERVIPPNYPRELVVKIQLPLVARASEADLDVSNTTLNLKTTNGKHAPLNLTLPYQVHEEQGAAKFDKKGKVLTVTLPVQPPPPKAIPRPAATPEHQDNLNEDELTKAENDKAKSELPPPPAKKSSKADHGRWVSEPPPSQTFDLTPPPAPAPASAPPEEKSLKYQKPKRNFKVDGDFVPSETFLGGHAGYVFKMGDEGLGYYKDKTSSTKVASANPAFMKPSYEYRQNACTVTILVQIPEIKASSVIPKWKSKQVIIEFQAKDGLYQMDLHLFGEIDTAKCRFDIATRNMVVILYKKTEGLWDSLEIIEEFNESVSNTERKIPIVKGEAFKTEKADKMPLESHNSSPQNKSTSSSADDSSSNNQNIISAELGAQEMRLKNSLIFELD